MGSGGETQWLPGLIVLGGALLIGVIYLLATRRRNQRLHDRDEAQVELDRKAQLYLEQLKELMQEQHQLPPEHFQAEKSRLELLAAAAMKARDEYRADAKNRSEAEAAAKATTPTPPAPQGFFDRNPQLKGAIWGAGVVLFFVVLGLWLSQEQKDRGDGEATGRIPPMAIAPEDDPREQGFQRALERVKRNPSDVDFSGAVVHELIRREDWDQAMAITERALGVDPFHPEHRVHRALFQASQGKIDEAIAELERLSMVYPDAHEALLFIGTLSLERGDHARALKYLERFDREAPLEEKPSQLPHAIAEIRQKMQAGSTAQ